MKFLCLLIAFPLFVASNSYAMDINYEIEKLDADYKVLKQEIKTVERAVVFERLKEMLSREEKIVSSFEVSPEGCKDFYNITNKLGALNGRIYLLAYNLFTLKERKQDSFVKFSDKSDETGLNINAFSRKCRKLSSVAK